jgi:hypothetical protein|tara:strand:+ start:1474 stop:1704 length:231 start_codon:yes stop_codon:yes gene_type:complete
MVGFDDSVVEEFVAQGRDARGEHAVELIARATSAPKLYVFGELLDLDGVKEVRLRCLFFPIDGPPPPRSRASTRTR